MSTPSENTVAFDYVLDLLMSKKIMPGDKISDIKLAKEIGCSRSPVRDALKQLENCGLVDIHPNRYMQVTVYTPEMISEVGSIRLYLEQLAGKLALMLGNRMDFQYLRQLAERCQEELLNNNFTKRLDLDCEFHMALSRISGHKLLLKFQKEMYLRVKFIILHHPYLISSKEKHTQQHFDIVDALEAGDKEQLERAIQKHIVSFYGDYTTLPESIFL